MKSLREEYREKLVTAQQAVRLVKSGDWVEFGGFAACSVTLDKALAARKDELHDVKVRAQTRIAGVPEVVKADPTASHFRYHSFHFSSVERKLHDQGLCWFIPIHYSEVPRYYRSTIRADVVLIPVTPMDEHGWFNFGPSCSYSRSACETAGKIVLEVNPKLPRCLGGREESIHLSEADAVVETEWDVPEIPNTPATEVDRQIAGLVMERLEDGSCLQLGIGAMPNVVGALIAQSDLKDLGVHTEMFTDSMVDMIAAGRINCRRKNIDKGRLVYTFCMGTRKAYDFLHNNPQCAAYPVDYTNDPFVISRNDKVMAINNCLAIDLFGQASSESSGPRHISGAGGQVDFLYGAYRSQGGQGFLCFSSTAKRPTGTVSRVVPTLPDGTVVSADRALVSYVVTEHGMVNLKGKSTWERAEALISIAHPDFREELIQAAEKLGIWRWSNKKAAIA